MMQEQSKFESATALNNFIVQKQAGHLLVNYINIPDYEGMVLGIGIVYNTQKSKYHLNLEWISFGLDLYAENLLESYVYGFKSLADLLHYLELKYQIPVTAIGKNYKIDESLYPNPLRDANKRIAFEEAWENFQEDFKKGFFLDKDQDLIYSSNENSSV